MDHDPRALRDQVRVQLERVLAVLERVVALTVSGGSLPGRRAGTKPTPASIGDRSAEDEAARLGAEDDVRLLLLHPAGEIADGLLQRRRVREQRRDVLEPHARRREVGDLPDLRAQVESHGPSLAGRARRGATTSSCASSASYCRSCNPARGARRCAREAPGATSCSSSAASRPAAVRNVRRCRGVDPKRESCAQVAATSASESG